jgi:casein kinase II subunit alpha
VVTKPKSSSTAQKQVVLKCAPGVRLQREKEILQQFERDTCIRQLVDHAKEPTCLILEHLESDALRLSGHGKISRQDGKFIARNILSALASLHAKGIAHAGKMTHVHPARQIWPGCQC